MKTAEYHNIPNDPLARLETALESREVMAGLGIDGPLHLEDISSDQKTTAFAACVERYGWPSEANADDIAPTREGMYADADEFWAALFDDFDDSKYMNNFKNWLSIGPVDERYAGMSMSEMAYGMQPALHRAHVLYGDLFTGLNEAFPTYDRNPLNLTDEERAVLPEAAFTAYQLLGKLLTEDDQRMTVESFGGSPVGVEDVTDAHIYMWR